MDISEEFKAYCAEVVAMYFMNATPPDGGAETSAEHLRRKSNAVMHILGTLRTMHLDPDDRYHYERYVEEAGQSAIVALFPARSTCSKSQMNQVQVSGREAAAN